MDMLEEFLSHFHYKVALYSPFWWFVRVSPSWIVATRNSRKNNEFGWSRLIVAIEPRFRLLRRFEYLWSHGYVLKGQVAPYGAFTVELLRNVVDMLGSTHFLSFPLRCVLCSFLSGRCSFSKTAFERSRLLSAMRIKRNIGGFPLAWYNLPLSLSTVFFGVYKY